MAVGQTQIVSTPIDLSGPWKFAIDRNDKGISEKWFSKKLDDEITLPGSMTTNGKGDDITVNTDWTGSILDSSWFKKPEYNEFRQEGNVKVPFWLQPVKYYKGAAWYQREITIPKEWDNQFIQLLIERAHWETTVWIDNVKIGSQNSLGTPHLYKVPNTFKQGNHTLTIRVDNRIKDVNVGQNSHSISDHTQSNWNGMIGRIELSAKLLIHIENVQIYPDREAKKILVKCTINNSTGKEKNASLNFGVHSSDKEKQKSVVREIKIGPGSSTVDVEYAMGENPVLWSEFKPHLYHLTVELKSGKQIFDKAESSFGIRNFSASGSQFTVNGTPIFLRGTLECAIFPKTGYPPTDTKEWIRIFSIAKSYGLNHLRFHSWCPPEAAFKAADSLGFYLQIECSSWANWGTELGAGKPIDKYIYDESNSIVNMYGNHPSFCMMAYGNEPGGKNHVKYLTEFVDYWKKKDGRRQYTSGAGWPAISDNNYNNLPEPRIQHWGEGNKSIINSKPPSFSYDWSEIIKTWTVPTVSHEIGQWCVYPDFKEISQYDGVLKAKNFEIFQHALRKNGMPQLADSFLLASGKLQVLCYKADIEAALRTKNFGGFQLLDIHDFPGQGTALVGVLNPFWKEKGYVTGKEFRQFCNTVVPLARMNKMIYLNNEELNIPIEVANFSGNIIEEIATQWNIKDPAGKILFEGVLPKSNIPVGNALNLGTIKNRLDNITHPSMLTLNVSILDFHNSWDFFVYPATLPALKDDKILVTQKLNDAALKTLSDGGKVLLSIPKGAIKPEVGGNVEVGFSSIFWNTAWTNGQAPHTLGILCNPNHPALKNFPSQYHSNWQWWDAMSHSNAIILDSIANDIKPIVRIIDDWVTARPLGLVFECAVGKGKLLISAVDLITNQEKRPEARQLFYSLKSYMVSESFQPKTKVSSEKITSIFN